MTTARDIMTPGVECARSDDTLQAVGAKLRDLDVGSLPVCGPDDKLKGMITDRDIVIKCVADSGDPTTATVASLGETEVVTIGADDDLDEALRTMTDHQVRRLPVIDGHDLIGMISQADIAKALTPDIVGNTVRTISE